MCVHCWGHVLEVREEIQLDTVDEDGHKHVTHEIWCDQQPFFYCTQLLTPVIWIALQFELLFCIHDDKDASLMVVKRLIEKYPNVEARIFLGGAKVGINPKINNMQPGYDAAKYELVLISDSGIRSKYLKCLVLANAIANDTCLYILLFLSLFAVRDDTLLDMVSSMKDDVALVHQMPYTCDRAGFPSTLEKVS